MFNFFIWYNLFAEFLFQILFNQKINAYKTIFEINIKFILKI